jgi:predicted AlkP superfamily phosphohydrolase/phosphomutase
LFGGPQAHPWPGGSHDPAYARVVRNLGRNPIGRETPVAKTAAQLERICHDLVAAAALKARLIRGILRDRRPDVLISIFGEVHRGGHVLLREGEEREEAAPGSLLLSVYRAVDRAVGEILEAVDPGATDVLLFSNHGMTRDNAQGHLVRPLMQRINEVFLGGHGSDCRPGRSVVRYLRGHVPARLQHAVGAAAPDRVRQWVVERELVGGLDWSRTPGFALRTDIRTELRLNLAGREARGILPAGGSEQARYVRLATQSFRQLVDAGTGEPLVAEVVDTSKAHPGPRCDRLPDLVITWRDLPVALRARSPEIGEVAARPFGIRGGDHNDDGFALLLPAARRAASLPPPPQYVRDLAGFITALATAAR